MLGVDLRRAYRDSILTRSIEEWNFLGVNL
jgi:hypothetical protein